MLSYNYSPKSQSREVDNIPLHKLLSRVHNKRSQGEYPTLTLPCTNALHKVCAVNHLCCKPSGSFILY